MMLIFILVLSVSRICRGFTPKDHYLLYCGPSSNSVAGYDGRVWSHDQNSTFSSPSSFSPTATAFSNHDLVFGSPFTAARIFNSSFTYNFPVSPGPKFIRLFFYPTRYSDQYDASQFFVTVQANNHVLLRNFSAQLAVDYAPFTMWQNITPDPFILKEYYVPVGIGESSLKLTFTPSPQSPYAFVNGIEVVSVPKNLYVNDSSILESPLNPFQIPNTAALETLYCLNVGGSAVNVDIDGEVSGMYRLWKNDDPYLFSVYGQPALTNIQINYTEHVPNYTVPEGVYQTERHLGDDHVTNMKHNLTWRLMVDPGFYYMVRLHWCELDSHINTTKDRIFEVYINNQTVEDDADVLEWTNNQRNVPTYRDYVVYVTGRDETGGSTDVWIALHPSTKHIRETSYNEVLLNGMEIFKVNKLYDGSLYAPNPQVSLHKTPLQQAPIFTERRTRSNLLPCVIGGVAAGLLVTLLACLLTFRCWKTKKESTTNGTFRNMIDSSLLCRRFSLEQIMLATNNFSEELIVGRGGFGNVYKGMVDVDKEPLVVAIKRLNPSSKQGLREFLNEIALLSELQHAHLVSLIGYCNESEEMILLYEYMQRGTLREHLYNQKPDNPPLSWTQRLHACIGAAKGLQYLHSGQTHMIIHRDVKSTNILLDENWVSKVSDFGISKLGPTEGDLSHVSTVVKGSFGYLDPEYYKTQRLTEKSDVHSFGVVLFEALCGRAALDPTLIKEYLNLALWAQSHQRKGAIGAIVDPNIKGEIAPACLKKFGEIAEKCVRKHGKDRPSMADVVTSLELALELQQQASIIQIPA